MKIKGSLRVMVGLLAMVLLPGNNPVHGEDARGVTNDTIKMGVMLDITGPAAGDMAPILSGIRNCYRYVNDKGGVNGRMIKLLVEDDRYSIPMSLAGFKKLVFKDKVLHITGPTSSHGTSALLPQFKKEKMPMIAYTASDEISKSYNRYAFTLSSDYEDQTAVTIDYIMKEMKSKDPRIALVYPDNTYGKTFLKAAIEYLKLYGVKPVDQQVINVGAIDASTQMLGLKRAMATHVIHHGYVGTQIAFMRAMKQYRFTPYVFGQCGACTEVAIEGVPDMAPYYFGNAVSSAWYEDKPGVDRTRETTLKYQPGIEKPSRFYTLAWAIVVVVTEGLKRAGRDLSNETLIDALESLKDFDTGGLIAPVTYTKTSHKPNRYAVLYKADGKKGEFIRLGDWRKPLLKEKLETN